MRRRWRTVERGLGRVVPDVGPAVALAAFLLFVSPVAARALPARRPIDAPALVLVAAAALALVAWRRRPFLAWAGSLTAAAAYLAAGYPTGPVVLAPLGGVLAVVGAARTWAWLAAAMLGAAVVAAAQAAGGGWSPGLLAFAAAWLACAGAVAAALRLRRGAAADARARAVLAERAGHEEARRRVAEDRLRLARDLHDVVGHSLAVISLQAGVAEHLLDSRPEEVRRAVAAIRAVSRQALGELRAELSQLRGEPGVSAGDGSAPGLRAVPDLVAAMRDAGLAVDLRVEGGAEAVPDPVARAGYRVVQESLTNVVRHAGGAARATVRLAVGGHDLEIEVLDDGPGAPGPVAGGAGLRGMRERVAGLGGRFEAGGRPGGGFRVWALLPLGVP
jgi:signal transduction histidine kinase